MKPFTYSLILFISACLLLGSCKKDVTTAKTAGTTIVLTTTDNNGTVNLSPGQKLSLTIGDPGDGGYTLNDIQYTSTVLTLNGLTRKDGNVNSPGDAGTDTWAFTATSPGTSIIKITANRGTSSTIDIFTTTVTVK